MLHNLLQKISNLLPYWKSMKDVQWVVLLNICKTVFHISQNQSLYTNVYQRICPLVFCEHSLVVTC